MRKIITSFLAIVFVIAFAYGNHINASAAEVVHEKEKGYVFIGDSRTVGMNQAVNFEQNQNMFMVAKVGKGYNWFMEDGEKELQEIRQNNDFDEWVYIFNLGINDIGNADKYVELVNELSEEATLYYVSVNPTVDAAKGVQCATIEEFNQKIIDGYNNYIDSYHYLKDIGYNSNDGLHYDNETYRNIYNFIIDSVK